MRTNYHCLGLCGATILPQPLDGWWRGKIMAPRRPWQWQFVPSSIQFNSIQRKPNTYSNAAVNCKTHYRTPGNGASWMGHLPHISDERYRLGSLWSVTTLTNECVNDGHFTWVRQMLKSFRDGARDGACFIIAGNGWPGYCLLHASSMPLHCTESCRLGHAICLANGDSQQSYNGILALM